MKNGYRIQNSCANCEFSKVLGGYEEPEHWHCTKWVELGCKPPGFNALTKQERVEIIQLIHKIQSETYVEPQAICDDWELKKPREPVKSDPNDIPF